MVTTIRSYRKLSHWMNLPIHIVLSILDAGRRLREKISEPDASVVFYRSPYLRTEQTLDQILPFFDEKEIVSCLEEPRICEQQIGNFQNVQQILGEFMCWCFCNFILYTSYWPRVSEHNPYFH